MPTDDTNKQWTKPYPPGSRCCQAFVDKIIDENIRRGKGCQPVRIWQARATVAKFAKPSHAGSKQLYYRDRRIIPRDEWRRSAQLRK